MAVILDPVLALSPSAPRIRQPTSRNCPKPISTAIPFLAARYWAETRSKALRLVPICRVVVHHFPKCFLADSQQLGHPDDSIHSHCWYCDRLGICVHDRHSRTWVGGNGSNAEADNQPVRSLADGSAVVDACH